MKRIISLIIIIAVIMTAVPTVVVAAEDIPDGYTVTVIAGSSLKIDWFNDSISNLLIQAKPDNNANKDAYGLYNGKTGEVVLPAEYAHISWFSGDYARVRRLSDDKWGIVNKKGEIIVPFEYDSLNYGQKGEGDFPPIFSDGLTMVAKSVGNDSEGLPILKWGFADLKGKVAIPLEYDFVYEFSDGIAGVMKNNKWGAINTKGEVVIPLEYDEMQKFFEGFAGVRKGVGGTGKAGIINTKGEIIVPIEYDYTVNFSYGYAVVIKDGKRGAVNTKGQLVIPLEYDRMTDFYDGSAVICKDEQYGVINVKGEVVMFSDYDYVGEFRNGLARVRIDEKYGAINTKGELVIPVEYDSLDIHYSSGYVTVGKKTGNTLHGMYNTKGELIIPAIYRVVNVFSNGYAAVQTFGDTSGYYDTKGNIAFPFEYELVNSFDVNGLAIVGIAGKSMGSYGIINNKNEVIVPINFDYTQIINVGNDGNTSYFWIREDSKWGIIAVTTPGGVRKGAILDGEKVTINDALEILKFLAKLPNEISVNGKESRQWNASLIVGGSDSPTINDALEILKKLAKLDNKIDSP